MPVKRRIPKRAANAEREYEIWESIFDSGHDYFGELPELGLAHAGQCRVSDDLVREPWARLGARYLADRPGSMDTWAEMQFGRPWECNDS